MEEEMIEKQPALHDVFLKAYEQLPPMQQEWLDEQADRLILAMKRRSPSVAVSKRMALEVLAAVGMALNGKCA